MKRQVLYLVSLAVCIGLARTLWPERASVLTAALVGGSLLIGMWGTVSLRSGIWCKARWRAQRNVPQVSLTYDDGPDPEATPALLDLLEERGVHATFFCVGKKVRAHPQIMRRMRDGGHEIGNHSNQHSNWTNFYMDKRMRAELSAAQDAFDDVLGKRPRYFRPPIGLANHATGNAANSLGMTVVGWQVRGFDLPGSDPARVAKRILGRVRPGGVVLLHDGDRDPLQVVKASTLLLDGLAQHGLQVVPLDTLFSD